MKKKYMHWMTVCLYPLLFVNAAESAHASNARMIYGAEQGRHLNAHQNTQTSYILQLASFKNERYANDYKTKMAAKTSGPVRVVYKPQSNAPYHVVIGPLTGTSAVVQVSQELLSNAYAHPHIARVHAAPVRTVETKPIHAEPILAQYTRPTQAAYIDKDAALIERTWTPALTVSGGPAWGTAGDTQTLSLQPNIQNTYAADKISRSLGTGELFLGVQRAIKPSINGQLGLALAGSSNIGLNGDIWEDSNPALNNNLYHYKVDHAGIMAKGKLIGIFNHPMQPYVSAGLGIGFNRSHDFTTTPRIVQEVPAPHFQSNTTTAFTYTLGLGVQRALTPHWQVGMGYEFADWGQNSLARAPGQSIGDGLALNHLYTNELLFSLSYLK